MAVDADAERAKRGLASILQMAHSGELAAILAYRGHARSVRDPDQRAQIRRIEQDEHDHRVCVRKMLDELGVRPSIVKEVKLYLIGSTIGLLCLIGGWFIPMYGAGRLERGNIVEYEDAARLAATAGYWHFVEDLLTMAEVEWDHERYFREILEGHFLRRVFPRWELPPQRAQIRTSFAAWVDQAALPASRADRPALGTAS